MTRVPNFFPPLAGVVIPLSPAGLPVSLAAAIAAATAADPCRVVPAVTNIEVWSAAVTVVSPVASASGELVVASVRDLLGVIVLVTGRI